MIDSPKGARKLLLNQRPGPGPAQKRRIVAAFRAPGKATRPAFLMSRGSCSGGVGVARDGLCQGLRTADGEALREIEAHCTHGLERRLSFHLLRNHLYRERTREI